MAFKGRIQTRVGKFTETCVTENNLTENQLKKPIVRDFLEYADKRMISTLLVSGAVGPYGVGYVPTKLGKVDDSKLIGNNAYQFDIMGRIQRASVIKYQVGSTSSDGTFQLAMEDNYLVPGMNVLFHGAGFQARVQGAPTGSAGNYIYTFKSPDGTVFAWDTHVSPQGATKTCFGGYTSYGEKSMRGYGRSHTPDQFIVHMTTQRKSIGITGDAATDVIWYDYVSAEGKGTKTMGWRWEQERQAKAQFLMENEFQKWDGLSSMKNDDGTLRVKSRLQDPETGLDIVQGDGVNKQLEGGNEAFGSGSNGDWTYDDVSDMLTTLRKKSNMVEGSIYVGVTGIDGMRIAQREFPAAASAQQGIQLQQMVNQSNEVGGAKPAIGFNFNTFNFNGDTLVLIEHPLFSDADRYTAKAADGRILKSKEITILTMEVDGRRNVDIMSKGAYGINRSMVEGYLNGLTGINQGTMISEEDAIRFAMLKQDMIVVYNTTVCGRISAR
jgi:hypothetical protein